MNPTGTHSYEDKLLEFAYGELPAIEARAVEAHVKGCVRCADALGSIQGVRHTMAQLEPEPAPDAGLESLLAFAQQKARQIQAGPAPKRSRWRWLFLSVSGAAALVVVGIFGTQAAKRVELAPPAAAVASPPAEVGEHGPAGPQGPAGSAAVASPPAEVAQAVRDERGRYEEAKQEAPAQPQDAPAPEPEAKAAPAEQAAWKDAPKGPGKAQYAQNKAVQGMEVKGEAKEGRAGGGFAVDVDSSLGSVSTGGAERYRGLAKMDIPSTGTASGKKKAAPKALEEPEPAMVQAVPAEAPAQAQAEDADKREFMDNVQRTREMQRAGELARAQTQAPAQGGYGAAPAANSPPPPAPSAPAAAAPTPVASKESEASRSSLKLRGSRGTGSAASTAASDEFDSMFGGGQQPSSASTRSVNEKAGAKQDDGNSARTQAFVRLADQARQKGDHAAEVKYLRQALEYGAHGDLLGTVLGHLCEAETSVGVEEPESCQRVVNEFPLTQWAERVKRMKSPAADVPSRAKTAPAKKATDTSVGNMQNAL